MPRQSLRSCSGRYRRLAEFRHAFHSNNSNSPQRKMDEVRLKEMTLERMHHRLKPVVRPQFLINVVQVIP